MFFQVSWIRCHIVRIQGKKERRNPVKTGGKLLTLTIFDLELCSLHQKLRFEKPEWKIKCLGTKSKRKNQRFSLRCHIVRLQGEGRKGFERYIIGILSKFYQLFATVLRWSLENLKKKLPNLSFVWRERSYSSEKIELNKQTNKNRISANFCPRLVYDSSKRWERVGRSPRSIGFEFFWPCQTLARFSPKSDRVTKTQILLQKTNGLLIPTILSYHTLVWDQNWRK